MSSPVAVVGLTFKGYDPQRSDLDVFFEITEGLDDLPKYRGDDAVIPFRTGRLEQARIPDNRPIVLTGHVTGSGATPWAVYRAFVDELKGYFNPEDGAGVLVAVLEDGSTRTISAVPRNILPGEGWAEYRAFSIELEALAPFWRADWGQWMLDSGLYLGDGWYFNEGSEVVIVPTSSPYTATFSAASTATIEDAVVEIDGPSTGAVGVSVVVGGLTIGFTYPALTGGQTLVVDSGARTVRLNAVQARGNLALLAGNANGEYFRLAAGSNTVTVTGRPAAVTISLRRSFL